MFGLKDISLDFLTAYPYLVWLALLVLAGLTFLLYRHTNPPVPGYLRGLLATLRLIAIAALILALLEPVFGFSRLFERPQRIALLLDSSASMDKVERGLTRRSRLDSLLSSPGFDGLTNRTDITPYYFGGNLATAEGEVDPNRTSLGDAIRELEQIETGGPSDYWLLFCDGRSNSGQDVLSAATGLTTPVMVVDMASDAGEFDVGISAVDYNPVIFAGQPTEVAVKMSWHGSRDDDMTVELRQGDRVLDRMTMAIGVDGGLAEAVLKYTPQAPGQQLLTAMIAPLEGEETTDNNSRTFSVKVLKSRLLVALVSEAPDYEVGFLKRFLDESDKYDVELVLTGNRSGNFDRRFPTRATELNRYDLVVLHDPDPRRLEARRDILTSYLAEKGGALWVMLGSRYAAAGPADWFDRLLPFSSSRGTRLWRGEFRAEPVEGHLFHPTIRVADDQASIRAAWAELPPFQSLVKCDRTAADGVILAYATRPGDDSDRFPVLGYRREGPGKVLASAALPFWSWGFVNLGLGEEDRIYERFLSGAASWLTVTDDFDPIRILPDKKVFTRGETVRFEGFAYDQGYRPIPGATGVVRLEPESGDEPIEADLIAVRDGSYQADFEGLTPGKYRYRGRFDKDGRSLKETAGDIVIESFSLEEFDRRGDPVLLAALARETGGRYYRADEFERLLADLDTEPVEVSSGGELQLWGNSWLLIIMICALALEWILRKVNQLI